MKVLSLHQLYLRNLLKHISKSNLTKTLYMKQSPILLAIVVLLLNAKDGEVKFLLVNVENRSIQPPDFGGNNLESRITLSYISLTS